MKLREAARAFNNGLDAIIRPLSSVAGVVIGIMALCVFGNVFGRFFFNQPLMGIIELIEYMIVIITFFALPYAALRNEHVRADVLISRLPRRAKIILGSFGFLISAGVFAVITYQGSVNAIFYAQYLDKASNVLNIPIAPFRAIMALGSLLLSLKLLTYVFHPPLPEEEQEEGPSE